MFSRARLVVLAVALVAPLSACGIGTSSDGRPTVVTSFYPLQFVTARIAGEHVRIVDLTAPGVEPHDLELKVRQTAALSDADLVLYEKGFQPSVDSAVEEYARDTLEVGSTIRLKRTDDGADPHFWQDPARMADYADAIGDKLASVDPKIIAVRS